MLETLLLTLAISFAVQALFVAFAAGLRTDKVTDLSYGLTFVAIALVLWWGGGHSVPETVLTLMTVAWGYRLASYLLFRIVRIGRDARFDGVREDFWKFFQFWFFQGLVVWIVMLPVVLWFGRPGSWTWIKAASVIVWAVGLAIEAIADRQKFQFKQSAFGRDHWVDVGLWRYSRHPNYFGEMLCWWGTFAYTAPDLGLWALLGLAGPVTITLILLFVTGIPTLEKSARQKWGGDPDYEAYRRRTRLLVPIKK